MNTRMVLVVVLSGCGPGEVLEAPELTFPEEPRCLSCNAVQPEQSLIVEAAPNVRVSPTELLFYPTHGDADEHDPGFVRVTNNYDFIVMVTRTRIDDDLSPGVRSGGADYFVFEPLETWIELSPEEAVALPVWFIGSEKQRSARLAIFTTAYEHRRLEVAVTGKTILR